MERVGKKFGLPALLFLGLCPAGAFCTWGAMEWLSVVAPDLYHPTVSPLAGHFVAPGPFEMVGFTWCAGAGVLIFAIAVDFIGGRWLRRKDGRAAC